MRDGSLGGLPDESPALSEQRLRHRAIPIIHAARLSALHEEFAGLSAWRRMDSKVMWWSSPLGSASLSPRALREFAGFDPLLADTAGQEVLTTNA
jgi:hypothetical protein